MLGSEQETINFYIRLGYSDVIVREAYRYAKDTKIDIFDAIQQITKWSSEDKNTIHKQYRSSKSYQPFDDCSLQQHSFLQPLTLFKQQEYDTILTSKRHKPRTPAIDLRQTSNPVGLLNVSNCCYLNSLLQCYFHMKDLMLEIFKAKPIDLSALKIDNEVKKKRIMNEFNMLTKMQQFFSEMAMTSKKYLDPSDILRNLVDSVGNKLTYGEEKDLFEINIGIIERLGECMMYTQRYYREDVSYLTSHIAEDEFGRGDKELGAVNEQNSYLSNSLYKVERSPIKNLLYGIKAEYTIDNDSDQSIPRLNDFLGLIINPIHQNLYNALNEQLRYEVTIKQRRLLKQIYIRSLPVYLFFYINQTSFDRQQQQTLKSNHKFTFDFVIYMDRYMEKYKNLVCVGPEVEQLLARKNIILKQINCLHLLAEKLGQCRQLAQQLTSWQYKFPNQEQIESEMQKLNKELQTIESDLECKESRKEKYVLVYMFVHRGDAASGHYWGYGRNGRHWYRFDINCKQLQESQIIADMEKSGGAPYSLLYVKPENVPSFNYDQKLEASQELQSAQGYVSHINPEFRERIIRENQQLQKRADAKRSVQLAEKIIKDYLSRYNVIKKIVQTSNSKLAYYNNYSLYLYSIKQIDLYKQSLMEQATMATAAKAGIPSSRLLASGLNAGQSQFMVILQSRTRKMCKGQYRLKVLANEELLSIKKATFEDYIRGKTELIWGFKLLAAFSRYVDLIDKSLINPPENLQSFEAVFGEFNKLHRLRIFYQTKALKSNREKRCSLVSKINQVWAILLLALAIDGFSQLELTYNSESNFIGAIIALMQKNTLKIVSKDLCDKECSVALRQMLSQQKERQKKLSALGLTLNDFSKQTTFYVKQNQQPKKIIKTENLLLLLIEDQRENEESQELYCMDRILQQWKNEQWKIEEIDSQNMNYKFKQQTKELVNRISMKLDIMRELERGNLELTRSILEARKLPQLKLRNRHREQSEPLV